MVLPRSDCQQLLPSGRSGERRASELPNAFRRHQRGALLLASHGWHDTVRAPGAVHCTAPNDVLGPMPSDPHWRLGSASATDARAAGLQPAGGLLAPGCLLERTRPGPPAADRTSRWIPCPATSRTNSHCWSRTDPRRSRPPPLDPRMRPFRTNVTPTVTAGRLVDLPPQSPRTRAAVPPMILDRLSRSRKAQYFSIHTRDCR